MNFELNSVGMAVSIEQIRPYRQDDLAGIAELVAEARAWPPTGAPGIEELLVRWRRRNVRAEQDVTVLPGPSGELLAYVQSSMFRDGTPRLSFELAVHPECRHRGIGTYLYNLVQEKAERLNVTHLSSPVYLLPDEEPPEYAGFLARRGFDPHHSYWQMRLDDIASQEPPRWPTGISWRRFGEVAVDAEKWAQLVTACFDEYSSASMVAAQLSEPGGGPQGYFFAVDETTGQDVGTSRSRIDLAGGKRVGYIGTVGVLPQYRGRGIGESLVRLTLQHIARQGIERATLLVEDQNTNARRLYERMGWRAVYRTDYYWKQLASPLDEPAT